MSKHTHAPNPNSVSEQETLSRLNARIAELEAENSALRARFGFLAPSSTLQNAEPDIPEDIRHASHERLVCLARYMPALIWETNARGETTFFNAQWVEFTGHTEQEHYADVWKEAIHPDDVQRCETAFNTALKDQTSYEVEYRMRNRQGEYRWLLERGAPAFSPQGEFLGMVGSDTDVTELKQIEIALRNSQAELEKAYQRQRETLRYQRALLDIERELTRCTDFDDLCYRAVALARSKLGIDRASLWFYDREGERMRGSFGVDEMGNIRDERERSHSVQPGDFLLAMMDNQCLFRHRQGAPLLNHQSEVIGNGETFDVALWDGEQVLGVLVTDNLFSAKPFTLAQREILALYGAALGSLCARLRALLALCAEEKKYQTLVENLPDTIARFDRNLRYCYVSPAAKRHSGVSNEDYSGRTDRELGLPGEIADGWEAALRQVFETGQKGMFEWELETRIVPEFAPDGNVETVLTISRDVRERRKMEAALRESEQKFRSVVENIGEGVVILEDDGAIVYANQRVEEITGFSVESLIGHNALEVIIAAEHRDEYRAHYRDRDKNKIETCQVEIAHKEGRRVHALCTLGPNRRADGGLCGTVAALTDISDRVKAEQSLREIQAYQELILNTAPISLFLLREEDKVGAAWMSRSVEKVTGFPPEQFIRSPLWISRIHPEDRDRVLQELHTRREDGHYTSTYRWQVADGSYHWFLERTVEYADQSSTGKTFIGIGLDITEQKQAEELLRRHNQELRTLNRLFRSIQPTMTRREIFEQVARSLKDDAEITVGLLFSCQNADSPLTLELAWGGTVDTTIFEGRTLCDVFGSPENISHAAHCEKRVQELAMCLGWTPARYLYVPFRANDDFLGLLVLCSARPNAFPAETADFYSILGQHIGATLQEARLYSGAQERSIRLQMLTQQLVDIQERERREIAREFHDELGQLITGLRIYLERGLRAVPDDGMSNIRHALVIVNELSDRVRTLVNHLRPPMLDDMGIVQTLYWHLEQFEEQTGIQVLLDANVSAAHLEAGIEITLYRIVQEALTNIARHANVTEATVHLWSDPENVHLEIRDEGEGFSMQQVLSRGLTSGISGMMERARLLGGKLEVVSAPGSGTSILATLPLKGVETTHAH
jgi:PAS domain S-box-containing protein